MNTLSETVTSKKNSINARRIELLLALNHPCVEHKERVQAFTRIFSMSIEELEQAVGMLEDRIDQYNYHNH